jgi:hypothetical protein
MDILIISGKNNSNNAIPVTKPIKNPIPDNTSIGAQDKVRNNN